MLGTSANPHIWQCSFPESDRTGSLRRARGRPSNIKKISTKEDNFTALEVEAGDSIAAAALTYVM